MPAATTRLSLRRRRSSLSLCKSSDQTSVIIFSSHPTAAFQPAKAGIYGISRPVTFAPNVTPVSYHDDSSTSEPGSPTSAAPSSAIFPPSETPAPPPARRRCPPGKRRSLGYIPRPPNAFMLFRADFVRQKHVPGTIETNHGSLSKIIGNCWRSLPLDEKKIWEVKAKHAKSEHKIRYPEYRFKPVHNKHKNKEKKEKPPTTVEDERKCEEIAQLLLEGKKGDELAAAVRDLDFLRSPQDLHQAPFFHAQPQRLDTRGRRPSSVPLPNDYYPHFPFTTPTLTLPTPPFLSTGFQPEVNQFRNIGARRPSSARPYLTRSWTVPGSEIAVPHTLERDNSPLPEVDASLWDPSFRFDSTFPIFDNRALSSSSPSSSVSDVSCDILTAHHLFTTSSTNIDPLSWMGSDPLSSSSSSSSVSIQEMFQGPTDQSYPYPTSSSTYSPSPPPSVDIVPTNGMEVFAPKPQSATAAVFPDDLGPWQDLDMSPAHQSFDHGMDLGLGVEMGMGMSESYPKTSFDVSMQAFSSAFGGAHEGVPMVGIGAGPMGDAFEMEFHPQLGMF